MYIVYIPKLFIMFDWRTGEAQGCHKNISFRDTEYSFR